jgi:colanic acid biosynthesis glycosyl transferase WcaI
MRVTIVTQYFFPESFVINELAMDLANAGHTITVLTGMPNYPSGKIPRKYLRICPVREKHGRIRIIRVPLVSRGQGSKGRLALNYISFALSAATLVPFLLRDNVDAILVFEPSPITVGIPALVIKQLKRAPIVFWVQDLWPESLIATGAVRNRAILSAVRALTRFIYNRSDIVLVQSKSFIAKIREIAPDAKDIRFFPNPASRFYRPISVARDAPERKLIRPGFRVIVAGNMGAAQDLGTVLQAAERLRTRPEIQWILIGDGRLRPWVEQQIETRGLSPTVQILGPYPPEKMPTFFALADVLLATLRRDSIFSLTIPSRLQAYLASGRPVLAAIEGEAARVIQEAQAGLVCAAGDPASLANAVESLYETPVAERESMGRAGRRYFEREFDPDMLVKRLDMWLRQLRGPNASSHSRW